MRIASYNILSGGFSSYDSKSIFPERIEVLKEAIKLLNADLVGLIDTFRWDSMYTNEQIAKMFGYKSAYCINLNDERLRLKGHNNGITILTNQEVTRFETISIGTRDAVKTSLLLGDKQLDVYSVYLDDLSEDVRVSQIKQLLAQIQPNTPSIVMGDFNTMRKQDMPVLRPMIDAFFDDNPRFAQVYKPVIAEMMRGETIDLLENGGYFDIALKAGATAPTKLFPVQIDEPILRLDYAYSNRDNLCKNFAVMREKLFDTASDHYPIAFDCQIV